VAIRGLVFDFGGVIVNMRWDVARQIEEEYGFEKTTLTRSLYDNDLWREVEVGRGDIEAWRQASHRRLEELAGRELPLLHEQWRQSWGPIRENLGLIRALRPPYKVSILSNADNSLVARLKDGMDIHHWFDDVISSADVGLAKPDPAIYRLAAERLALEVEECLFIDDMERNVVAAREVGMAAVHFRVHEGDNLAEQLAGHGVVAPAPA
jgi:putative hydrolase of the HAD superfamily